MTPKLMQHGGQLRSIAERYNIPACELLDFSANINPEGPPSAVVATLRESLDDLTTLTNYPDLEHASLKAAIGRYASVPGEAICVANGFVPLLQAVLGSLRIRHCLLPVPAFVEYRRSLALAGVRVTPHILSSEASFGYNFDAMLSGGHDAVLLANPQNPSGVLTCRAALGEFVAAAAQRSIVVLLDEAFIDYAPEHTLASEIQDSPNLIVFRSVTKFFAIPGLRVAFALARPDGARSISDHLAPWPVSTIASRAAEAALSDPGYASVSRSLNERRRAALAATIRSLGIHVYPAAANFLLLRLPNRTSADKFFERVLLRHRVVLRDCSNFEGLAPDHLRVAVRTEAENAALVESLREALEHLW